MNKQEIELAQDVMRRVRMVYVMRFVAGHQGVRGAVLAVCCIAVIYTVSIPSVLANISQLPGFFDSASYLFVAFLNTEMVVQASLILAIGAGSLLAYDTARKVQPVVLKRYSDMRGMLNTPAA